jgi:hypothetical protein
MKKQINATVDPSVKEYIVKQASDLERSEAFIVARLVNAGKEHEILVEALTLWPRSFTVHPAHFEEGLSLIQSLKNLAITYNDPRFEPFINFVDASE